MPTSFAPLIAAVFLVVSGGIAQALDIRAAVLRVDYPELLPISRYDLAPDDLAFAGAALADEDNATTGRFLGHTYETAHVATAPEEAEAALAELLADGIRYVVIAAKGPELLALSERAAEAGALVFNARAPEVSLRGEECRANLLHIAPSMAMQADAVAQFAIWKQWTRWLLVSGSNPEDRALAEAYRRRRASSAPPSSRSASSRIPAARGAPTAAMSWCSASCRPSCSAPRRMTW